MLVCNNVECTYGVSSVFQNLSFTADPGSVIVLHGANGTGKTSLLRMLSGLKTPSDGGIFWHEAAIGKAVRDGVLSVNYIGHERKVKGELTVLENLNFWADLHGERKSIPHALEIFGLGNYRNFKCADLSRGWQKRVTLARLVFCPAELWVLDEPYNNLDHEVSRILDGMIAEKSTVGGVIVLSSHMHVPIDSAVRINISDFAPRLAA